MPNLPTSAAAGVKGVAVVNGYALIAPQKTPQAIIGRLSAETNRAMRSPDMMKTLLPDGSAAVSDSPANLTAHLKAETELWGRAVKTTGIRGN